ncbi:MAG: hypothetical protein K6T76_04005 [Alicyclobacillus mali]|uniref:hypothetical protein n=1 Tax=Alicyclobacillus mali (ex Roth et al. 2021) TaxID=1123961 RepID=UPI0023F2A2E7|nr:hypothetical protein [Alicyclobacillus mali (ex Roth et al. 2021)]MCL6488086.1 hypothetical protein [Alicyclobacillus mali (ex Roth et al. 2021)]
MNWHIRLSEPGSPMREPVFSLLLRAGFPEPALASLLCTLPVDSCLRIEIEDPPEKSQTAELVKLEHWQIDTHTLMVAACHSPGDVPIYILWFHCEELVGLFRWEPDQDRILQAVRWSEPWRPFALRDGKEWVADQNDSPLADWAARILGYCVDAYSLRMQLVE